MSQSYRELLRQGEFEERPLRGANSRIRKSVKTTLGISRVKAFRSSAHILTFTRCRSAACFCHKPGTPGCEGMLPLGLDVPGAQSSRTTDHADRCGGGAVVSRTTSSGANTWRRAEADGRSMRRITARIAISPIWLRG